jgi:two-component system nitrate/nitrite response regulator NarL
MNNLPPQVRVLVADRHQLFREGLKLLLEVDPNIQVIGEASDGMEAAELARTLKPDVTLLDLSMLRCSASETLKLIQRLYSPARTIILVSKMDEDEILELLQEGACGFVLKESTGQLLRKSIHSVMAGQYWITRQGVSNLVRELTKKSRTPSPTLATPNWRLTPRENQIVAEIIAGCTNKEIADALSLSEQTVKHHLTSIFDKVGASSRLELALMIRHFGASPLEVDSDEEKDLSRRPPPLLRAIGNELSVPDAGKPSIPDMEAQAEAGSSSGLPVWRAGPEKRTGKGWQS